jgi:hypothetical protein
MLTQISIYRRTEKFANVVVPKYVSHMQNVTQVPHDVMTLVRNYARGATTERRLGIWSWEFQKVGQ